MKRMFLVVPALALAGCAATPDERRSDATASAAKVPPVEFRSAFEGYRPFADLELQDWRKANEEVKAAGGHGGHK
jgi:hypothetical protein